MLPFRLLCVWLFGLAAAAGQQPGDAILGVWEAQTADDVVHIEVQRIGDVYSGKIVWIKDNLFPQDDPRGMGGQPKVDRKNPDPALRTRPIVGVEVLMNMRYEGNGEWGGGSVYSPNRGILAQGKARLLPDGTLKVRGHVGLAFIGSSMQWRRIAAD